MCGEVAAAVEVLKGVAVLEQHPQQNQAYYALGVMHHQTGEFEEAKKY